LDTTDISGELYAATISAGTASGATTRHPLLLSKVRYGSKD